MFGEVIFANQELVMKQKSYPLGRRASRSLSTRVVPPARFLRKTLLAGGVALAVLAFGFNAQAANVTDTLTASSGTASLLTAGNWNLSALPLVGNDAVYSGTVTGIRVLTAGNLTVGSFDITGSSGTFGIRNATSTATDSILTLGGSGDSGNGVSGDRRDSSVCCQRRHLQYLGTKWRLGQRDCEDRTRPEREF